MIKNRSMPDTFAENHAKRLIPEDNYILDRLEIERRILDIFEDIKYREYMIYSDYQKLGYLRIPFVKMLANYKNIETKLALYLIKTEHVTYEILVNILKESKELPY